MGGSSPQVEDQSPGDTGDRRGTNDSREADRGDGVGDRLAQAAHCVDVVELVGGRVESRRSPPLRVVIVTTFDLDEYLYGVIRAGAVGFLLEEAGPAPCAESPASCRPTARSPPSDDART